MRKHLTYLGFLLLAVAGMFSCTDDNKPHIPSLRETYSARDKNPFGGYIAYHQIEQTFFRNTVRSEKGGLGESWYLDDDTGSIYISFSNILFATEEDGKKIEELLDNGNDVFLASNIFDTSLLERFSVSVSREINPGFFLGSFMHDTYVKIKTPDIRDTMQYGYFYYPLTDYFNISKNPRAHILGLNENGLPDFIVITRGAGRLFLHCEPRLFSNYFLLTKHNYQYFQQVLGYLRPSPEHVYWNEFYQKETAAAYRRNRNHSQDKSPGTLSAIFSQPALRAAFWLSLLALLLLFVYGMKRRQRMIAELKPNENSSVAFTETIGRLYLQKKDNKNIAEKMITYFNEQVRNNYFLNTNNANDDFITTLSRKSGVAREHIDKLYQAIAQVQQSATVSDYQLLGLNNLIQKFYKTLNR